MGVILHLVVFVLDDGLVLVHILHAPFLGGFQLHGRSRTVYHPDALVMRWVVPGSAIAVFFPDAHALAQHAVYAIVATLLLFMPFQHLTPVGRQREIPLMKTGCLLTTLFFFPGPLTLPLRTQLGLGLLRGVVAQMGRGLRRRGCLRSARGGSGVVIVVTAPLVPLATGSVRLTIGGSAVGTHHPRDRGDIELGGSRHGNAENCRYE